MHRTDELKNLDASNSLNTHDLISGGSRFTNDEIALELYQKKHSCEPLREGKLYQGIIINRGLIPDLYLVIFLILVDIVEQSP